MTTETPTPPSKTFTASILPWLLGAGMLVVYLVTLCHWVTPYNVGEVAEINGLNYKSHAMPPVMFLATSPLRLLPVSAVPLALNLFGAICAALALAQLARSVALLPHDRTYEQRQREQSEFSLLSIPAAWIPPLFAVVACGLQMTFWEHATFGTGETFDLLIFAFAIRCLLEYRIVQKESWLFRFAIVYGLGMANNWAMVGFFPAFLVALIWIKGIAFVNPRFLLRTVICGLAGLSVFALFPFMGLFNSGVHPGFWTSLYAIASADKAYLAGFQRDVLLVLGLTSVLPVLVIGMRWASYFGDNSPLGIFIATSMFHIIHGLLFLSCIWVMLDAPISPRIMGGGYAFLPFYYLSALCIGYFSGYFLLIFGTPVSRSKMTLHPLLRLLNYAVIACILVLFLAVPAILARKNLMYLRLTQGDFQEIDRYFARIEQALPPQGAVVLCDDSAEPYGFRLTYLEASVRRAGKSSPHLFVSAASLTHDVAYLAYLQTRNPAYELPAVWSNLIEGEPAALDVVHLLDRLSQNHPLYYLHPSFGYFFERFYATPEGLVNRLTPYPANVWDAPLPTPQQITFNQDYWKDTFTNTLPPLLKSLHPPGPDPAPGYWEKLLENLHLKKEKDRFAAPLAVFYSRSLDNWGVELERSGHLEEAGKAFDQAGLLNPANDSAGINRAFNVKLLAGKEIIFRPAKSQEDQLRHHRTWVETLTMDGPIDEPNCRDDMAKIFADGGNYRQSVQFLNRVKEIEPTNNRAPLELAQLLIYIQMYTNGLAVLLPYTNGYSLACSNTDEVLRRAPDDPSALSMKSMALMQLQAYDQAIEPLNRLVSMEATNYIARLNRGISYYKVGNLAAAKPDYEVVQKARPHVYQASYGLAKIAEQENDNPIAIKYYELYLSNAPPNSAEAASVRSRLKELKRGAPAP